MMDYISTDFSSSRFHFRLQRDRQTDRQTTHRLINILT